MKIVKGRTFDWRFSPSMSLTKYSCLKPIALPSTRALKVDKVMIPKPPIWMRARMTTWPLKEKTLEMSTVARPVTQVAEADMKSASTSPMSYPLFKTQGRARRYVPVRMTPRKLTTKRSAGCWKK